VKTQLQLINIIKCRI